jgi:hypothetical protein
MPLGFWPLPGYGTKEEVEAAKKRFDESYFGEFEGVWCKCFTFVPIVLASFLVVP